MEITYEDLKDILEMSGACDQKFMAHNIIATMQAAGMERTLGHAISAAIMMQIWFTPEQFDALIEAYIQYTGGKMGG